VKYRNDRDCDACVQPRFWTPPCPPCALGREFFILHPASTPASWLGLGAFLGSASRNRPAPGLPRRRTGSQRSSPNRPPASWLPRRRRGKRHVQQRSQRPGSPGEPGAETPRTLPLSLARVVVARLVVVHVVVVVRVVVVYVA